MEPLASWIERQYRVSAANMLMSVSPLGIVKNRPGFGQSIRAHRGAIVASPVPGAYDPEPDYFFHWYRDAALVVDAMRLLAEDEGAGTETRAAFADFVNFNLSLRAIDGRSLTAAPWRNRVAEDFLKYVRSDAELAMVHGEAVAVETRVNPDGTLDLTKWPRPQYDGPALRSLALLRWMRSPRFDPALTEPAGALVGSDLALLRRLGREPCYDIWEEELARHYYTVRVGAAALEAGADWLEEHGDSNAAGACRIEARGMLTMLDGYWQGDERYYRSRIGDSTHRPAKELDFAVILAAIHAADASHAAQAINARHTTRNHSVHDPRMHATLDRLEALFGDAYAINHSRAPDRAPAMGRYAGDVYYSGGAYYFSTLGAAEFCYRASTRGAHRQQLFARGDAYLRTVQAFTPESGELSEQFDQHTGAQRSARHLAWSYAAFISCIATRNAAAREHLRTL